MNGNSFFGLAFLAFFGGMVLAAQGGLNSHLGVLLRNPLLAAICSFISSLVLACAVLFLGHLDVPDKSTLKSVPIYLWFAGGCCTVLGLFLYFYTIPKLGISTMISLGLCGQLLFSLVAGHFGWLNLPVEPITLKKIIGIAAMTLGIWMITFK